MIAEIKRKKAIKAIHSLIIEARSLGYKSASSKDIADFLDGIEYLPTLMLEERDTTLIFEEHLKLFCFQYGCFHVINEYNK